MVGCPFVARIAIDQRLKEEKKIMFGKIFGGLNTQKKGEFQPKTYTVTLITPQGKKQQISVDEGEYIGHAAMRQDVDIPSSCNSGLCVSCASKVLDGNVVQESNFLKRKEEEAGFVLTCHCYPTSDCVILTGQEEALLNL
jgi:ferredoxin